MKRHKNPRPRSIFPILDSSFRHFQPLRQVVAQRALDFPRVEALAIVQAVEDGFDDPLGVVLPLVLDETVEKVLPGKRAIDLRFLVVFLKLGEVDHPVPAGVLGLTVNLEHDLIRLKQHRNIVPQVRWGRPPAQPNLLAEVAVFPMRRSQPTEKAPPEPGRVRQAALPVPCIVRACYSGSPGRGSSEARTRGRGPTSPSLPANEPAFCAAPLPAADARGLHSPRSRRQATPGAGPPLRRSRLPASP